MEYKEIEDDEYSTVTTTNQKLSWVYFIIFMSLLGLGYIYYLDSVHMPKKTSLRRDLRTLPNSGVRRNNNRFSLNTTDSSVSKLTNSGDFESQGNKILLDDYSYSPSLYLRPSRSSSQSYDS